MRKIFTLLIISFLAFSCAEDNPVDVKSSNVEKEGILTLSHSNVKIGAGSGTIKISVKSNTFWTVTMNNGNSGITGLRVSPLNGNGNGTVEVKYDALKTQYYSEQGIIIFSYYSYGYGQSKTVSIHRVKLP